MPSSRSYAPWSEPKPDTTCCSSLGFGRSRTELQPSYYHRYVAGSTQGRLLSSSLGYDGLPAPESLPSSRVYAPWLNPSTDGCCGLPTFALNKTDQHWHSSYYDRYLSDAAKGRLLSPIGTALGPSPGIPGRLSAFDGLPASETLPFRGLNLTVTHPHAESRDKWMHVELDDSLLEEALQYSNAGGVPRFVQWLHGLQERYHKRKYGHGEEGWSLSIGCDGHDLLFKALVCLLEEDDSILVEGPIYPELLHILRLLKCHVVEIETDDNGIVAGDLKHVLQNWPKDKKPPKCLYTVPYGCSATGASTTLERRSQVVKLAREFNFLILEDDPYFYLWYGEGPRAPSYFQLEQDLPGSIGHVMRFDSFSKVLSSGMRLGFVSGPTILVEAINRMTSPAMLQPLALTQAVTFSLLNQWGYDGFQQHVTHVAGVYRRKRNLFVQSMHKHLNGLAEWSAPEAGMDVWFRVSHEGDSEHSIHHRLGVLKEKVLSLPGTSFFAHARRGAYVRANFSDLSEEHFDEAMKRLASVVSEVKYEGRRVFQGVVSSRL